MALKRFHLLSALVFAALLASGCGSSTTGDDNINDNINTQQTTNNTTTDPNGTDTQVDTGIGYYKDSAVSGVRYTCGTQTGTTDANGTFVFEKGKGCTFELAGITLREVNATILDDNITIIEDNPKVARFLQSIDKDGDPTNGIQIADDVLSVLEQALQAYQDRTTVLEDQTELETVVAQIENNISDFNGSVVTEQEAIVHVSQTQEQTFKEKLAGKTWYVAGTYDEFDYDTNQTRTFAELMTVSINDDATSMSISESGQTYKISINGNRLVFVDDPDGGYGILEDRGSYIYVDDRYGDGSKDGAGHWLYTDKAKAQAKYNELKSIYGSTSATTSDTPPLGDEPSNYMPLSSDMLIGKTFYLDYENNQGSIGYVKLSFTSTSTVAYHEAVVDANGSTGYYSGTLAYQFQSNGRLDMKVDDGVMTFYLLSQSATEWRLQGTDPELGEFAEIWYLQKPSHYPSEL